MKRLFTLLLLTVLLTLAIPATACQKKEPEQCKHEFGVTMHSELGDYYKGNECKKCGARIDDKRILCKVYVTDERYQDKFVFTGLFEYNDYYLQHYNKIGLAESPTTACLKYCETFYGTDSYREIYVEDGEYVTEMKVYINGKLKDSVAENAGLRKKE